MDEFSQFLDSTHAAAQLGRLDLVSLLLAAIGLVLILGGLFAFFNFRAVAKQQAEVEAARVAKEVAERVANEYLQKELPDVMKAYREMMDSEAVTDDIANRMAGAQDEEQGGMK